MLKGRLKVPNTPYLVYSYNKQQAPRAATIQRRRLFESGLLHILTLALSGSRAFSIAFLDFISFRVLDSLPDFGVKLEPSKSSNAFSLGLDGTPRRR